MKKKEENVIYTQGGKKQVTETIFEKAQIDLVDEEFKVADINIVKRVKEIMLK